MKTERKKSGRKGPGPGGSSIALATSRGKRMLSVLIVSMLIATSFAIVKTSDNAQALEFVESIAVPWPSTFTPRDTAWDSTGNHAIVVGNDTSEDSNAWHYNSASGEWDKVIPEPLPVEPPETFTVGSGTGNYSTSIQAAVDAASPGDIVFVWPGTYYEHVAVDKAINLTGALKSTTIIHGNLVGIPLTVSSGWVNITGFTITGSAPLGTGVNMDGAHNSIFTRNIVEANYHGILMSGACDNFITRNQIADNGNYGIYLIDGSDNNVVRLNDVSSNVYGIMIDPGDGNKIYHNNFIGNTNQAYDEGTNTWNMDLVDEGNYWSDWTSPDINGDGIVDSPRIVPGAGGAQDLYPWAMQDGWNAEDISLVGDWHFNEGGGQYAYDSSGKGNTGTLGSGSSVDSYDPSWTTGISGSALRYLSVDYTRVVDSPSLDLGEYFSLEGWVRDPDFSTTMLEDFNFPASVASQNQVVVYLDDENVRLDTTGTTIPLGTSGPGTMLYAGDPGDYTNSVFAMASDNMYANCSGAGAGPLSVYLSWDGGSSWTNEYVPMSGVEGVTSYGGPGINWGDHFWIPGDFDIANFRVCLGTYYDGPEYSDFIFGGFPVGSFIDGIKVTIEGYYVSIDGIHRFVDYFTVTVYYHTGGYYGSGQLTSSNVIASYHDLVRFETIVTSLPAGTGLQSQYSQDNLNWYDSSGLPGSWDAISAGTSSIDLSGLGWSGTAFYYRIQFTSDGTDTPILDDITVTYVSMTSFYIIRKDTSYDLMVSSETMTGRFYNGVWNTVSQSITWQPGWNYFAYTSSATTKCLYFNGQKILEIPQASGPVTNALSLYFSSYQSFIGKIDEVKIWKRTLSPDDIQQRYDELKPFEDSIPIYDIGDLQAIQSGLAANYMLANDIDASETSGWNGGAGFTPVGIFAGRFNGMGHTITGLHVNRPTTDYVGLFGEIGPTAIVENVVLVDVNITGDYSVGGLVGYNNGGTVVCSSSSGSVKGCDLVGGLVGYNSGGTVSYSHSSVSVDATGSDIGGLVGYTDWLSFVTLSYATGDVKGYDSLGGLVGENCQGTISDSYSLGNINGNSDAGGLVGANLLAQATISRCYSTGAVAGVTDIGGLVGYNSGSVMDSFWDTDTSGKATSAGGTGKTTSQLLTLTTYAGWDFTNVWWMVDFYTRPFLRAEWSPVIRNSHELQLMKLNLATSYSLACDINLSDITQPSQMWGTSAGSGAGFVSVGDGGTYFTGDLNGGNHTLSNLYIDRSGLAFTGLFGVIDLSSTVQRVTLVDAEVDGGDYVGALIGYNNGGTVSYCSSSGWVDGLYYVGGLVGVNSVGAGTGTVWICHSSATVTGEQYVGGLVGYMDGDCSLEKSYATGNVNGDRYIGGLVGENCYGYIGETYAWGNVSGITNYVGGLVGQNIYLESTVVDSYSVGAVSGPVATTGGLMGVNSGSVANCFWDIETSGVATSAGGTGKTTAEMKTQSTFTSAGWDFVDTWHMLENVTYPLFTWQPLPSGSTAVYNTLNGVAWDNVHKRFWLVGEVKSGASTVYYVEQTDMAKAVPLNAPEYSFTAVATDTSGGVLVGGNGLPRIYYYDGTTGHDINEANSADMTGWNITGITFNQFDQRFYLVGNVKDQNLGAAFFTDTLPLTAASKCYVDMSNFMQAPGIGGLKSIEWNPSKSYGLAVGDGVYSVQGYDLNPGNNLTWSVIKAPEAGKSYSDISWDRDGWDEAGIVGQNMTYGSYWRYYDSSPVLKYGQQNSTSGIKYITCAMKPSSSPKWLLVPTSSGAVKVNIQEKYEGGVISVNIFTEPQIMGMTMYLANDTDKTNLFNLPVDAGTTYTFAFDFNYSLGWDDVNITLTAWHDRGIIGNLSQPGNWDNTSRTQQFNLTYVPFTNSTVMHYPLPDNGVSEFSVVEAWDETGYGPGGDWHRVFITVYFGTQTRAATGEMNPAMGYFDKNLALNDNNTWDMCVHIYDRNDPSTFNKSYEEFGIKEYAWISNSGTPTGRARPGETNIHLSSTFINYSTNTNHSVTVSIPDLFRDGNPLLNNITADSFLIRNMNSTSGLQSDIFTLQPFQGPNSPLWVWGNSSTTELIDAPLNGTKSAGPYTDYSEGFAVYTVLEWRLIAVPVSTAEGVYLGTITMTLGYP